MFSVSHQRLLREWVALVAFLAMVLGPLAVVTSRSLAAQERVHLAAGLISLSMCSAVDASDGQDKKLSVATCDHCLSASPTVFPVVQGNASSMFFSGYLVPGNTEPSAFLAQLRLPPATGPPSL